MIDRFLRAKHWQIFILLFAVPFIFQFIFLFKLLVSGFEGSSQDSEIFDFIKMFPWYMGYFVLVFFGWFWSLAMGLQQFIPRGLQLNTSKFKYAFFYPLVYIILFSFSFTGVILVEAGGEQVLSFLFILPLHLLAMFCMFYMIYFIAKSLRTAELQRKVTASDYIGEFFLLWIYIVGVWVIQPRVNKLFEQKHSQPLNPMS